MTLDVRAAGAGLSASDRPADAVGLHGVRRQLVMRLAAKLECTQQGRSALRRGGAPGPRGSAKATAQGADPEAHLAAPLSSLRAAGDLGQRLASADQRSASFDRENVADASTAGTADPAAIGLIAEPVREPDVVRTVLAALASRNGPAVSGGRPWSVPRPSASVEVLTPIRARADRHLALQRGDPARLDSLDEHNDVVVARLTLIPQPAQRASEIVSVHPWSIGAIER